MTDASDRTDRIAREAARLVQLGEAAGIDAAIRTAANGLRLHDAPLPSRGLVRKHARGMAMQALGADGYRESIRAVWKLAADIMAALEEAFLDARTMLMGRGARGEIDAGPELHIRIYTDASVTDLAAALVEAGYDEPRFATVNTRLGRLNRLIFGHDGVEVAITRLLPTMSEKESRDLFSGRSVACVGLAKLRERIHHRGTEDAEKGQDDVNS